jgi:hypothetical protein
VEVFARGGTRGGSLGTGLVDVGADSATEPTRRGGGGRVFGSMPVRFARNGTGGRFAASSACLLSSSSSSIACCLWDSCWFISAWLNGAPNPLRLDVVSFDRAAAPWYLTCLGGGAKVDGSLRVETGRATCVSLSSSLSFPLPIQPA